MTRRILTILLLMIFAAIVCVYVNPYSLHSFIYASYEGFDTIPDEDGIVRMDGKEIDFRLPQLTLSPQSVREIQSHIVSSRGEPDEDIAIRVARLVRSKLNARDDSLPRADSTSAESILRQGLSTYCLCSEHARLFVEAAQAVALQSRVVWLEGHVVAEYFDRQRQQWVFIDPHLGAVGVDEVQRPLSLSQAIHRLERDEPFEFAEIAIADEGSGHSLSFRDVAADDPNWYRNVLLNGEAYTCSGRSLLQPGRWSHWLRFRRVPQILVLTTSYDSSPGRFVASGVSVKRFAVVFLLSVALFWVLNRWNRGPGLPRRHSQEQLPEDSP